MLNYPPKLYGDASKRWIYYIKKYVKSDDEIKSPFRACALAVYGACLQYKNS